VKIGTGLSPVAPGTVGTDDIVAGLYTLAVLNLARWALERLG
jgi:hypothetical protein